MQAEIGVIGGSGLYSMPGFKGEDEVRIETPWGDPSDAYVVGELAGKHAELLRQREGLQVLQNRGKKS